MDGQIQQLAPWQDTSSPMTISAFVSDVRVVAVCVVAALAYLVLRCDV
jgi:hypothetical protein